MSRRGRVIAPGYPHHIVQRGHNRQNVFFTEEDRSSYLATLAEFREKLGIQVYAYCLMTNHVHLIVNPGSDAATLSLLMKRLAGRHTPAQSAQTANEHILGGSIQMQPH